VAWHGNDRHSWRMVTIWHPQTARTTRTAPDKPGAIVVNDPLRLGGYLPLRQIAF
jgi:hypothetical protein